MSMPKKLQITLCVNGQEHNVLVFPRDTLLSVLRDTIGLTGTKEACGTGECGSCTVLIDGEAILSCLTLAVEVEGKDITTIEGLSKNGMLSPLQQSFLDHGAVQCGFCIPGMVVSATALLSSNPNPSRADIQKALEGNICRCTGYNKILEAIESIREKT